MAKLPDPLSDCIESLRSIVERQTRLLDGLCAVLVNHESVRGLRGADEQTVDSEVAAAVFPLIQAAGSSTHTVIELSANVGLRSRDCMTIARTIVEGGINACYIMAAGSSVAVQATRHARQKAVRDLDRSSIVGDQVIRLVHPAKADLDKHEALQDDVAAFTSRAGREKGWTDLSVDDRMKTIGEQCHGSVLTHLHFARFAVYRHSSEIIHGTLFGALFFLGFTSPPVAKSPDDALEHIGQQHMLLLFAISNTITAIVETFHRLYGFEAAYGHSKELYNQIRKIPYFGKASDAEKRGPPK